MVFSKKSTTLSHHVGFCSALGRYSDHKQHNADYDQERADAGTNDENDLKGAHDAPLHLMSSLHQAFDE